MNRAPDRAQPRRPPPFEEDGPDVPYIIEPTPVLAPNDATVLARLDSPAVAQAAYEAAVTAHPGVRVVLRQGDRVLRTNGLSPPPAG